MFLDVLVEYIIEPYSKPHLLSLYSKTNYSRRKNENKKATTRNFPQFFEL